MSEFDLNENTIPEQPQHQPQQKKKKGPGGVIALALCFSLLGSALGSGITFLLQENNKLPGRNNNIQIHVGKRNEIALDEVETGNLMTPAQVYAQNVNSTVGITTSVTTNYWGFQTTSAASGSGFIISDDGYILTNYHVIQDSNSITVRLYDGTSYEAKIIGHDSANDIAVIKVDAEGLTPVVIGSSDKMFVGDTVVAIGNPLGELTFSLTKGVISAMDRQVTLSNGSTMELLQTDCSINSGNSGGALFNLYGEVVAITNAKYSNNGSATEASIENIGFAIPMEDAMPLVEDIIEKGYISKAYIGVSVIDVSLETQNYGLPEGAAVQEISEDSPAEDAGLKENDIITSVNGTHIGGSQDLVDLVGKASVGDKLEMEVYRKGETINITVTVGEKIQSALPEEQQDMHFPRP